MQDDAGDAVRPPLSAPHRGVDLDALTALSPPPMMGPGGLPLGTGRTGLVVASERKSPAVLLALFTVTLGLGFFVWTMAREAYAPRSDAEPTALAVASGLPRTRPSPIVAAPVVRPVRVARPAPASAPAVVARDAPADVLRREGHFLINQGSYREAIGVLERAVAAAPRDADSHYYLFLAWKKLEPRPSESNAWREARRVMELAPGTRSAREAKDYVDYVAALNGRVTNRVMPVYSTPRYTTTYAGGRRRVRTYGTHRVPSGYSTPPVILVPNSPSVVTPYGYRRSRTPSTPYPGGRSPYDPTNRSPRYTTPADRLPSRGGGALDGSIRSRPFVPSVPCAGPSHPR